MMDTSLPSLVIFIGFRKGAIKAALNLGLSFGMIVPLSKDRDKKIPASMASHEAMKFFEKVDHTEETVSLTLRIIQSIKRHGLMDRYYIRAVIALTEKSVLLAALLRQQLGVSGISPRVAELCHDKFKMKNLAKQLSIPITPFLSQFAPEGSEEFIQEQKRKWMELIGTSLGFPVVLKRPNESGGRFLKICQDSDSLRNSLEEGWQGRLLAEKFIEGKEFSVEAFIFQGEVIFSNITFYFEPRAINILPAYLEEELTRQLLVIHQKVIKGFNIERGITHTEFYLTPNGFLFGEVAIRPPGGYIMDLLEHAYGFNPWKKIIQLEMGIPQKFNNGIHRYASSWVIHPGAGVVKGLEGIDFIKGLPEVRRTKLKLVQGQVVLTREGAGDDVGHIIIVAENYDQLVTVIQKIRTSLKIQMDSKIT